MQRRYPVTTSHLSDARLACFHDFSQQFLQDFTQTNLGKERQRSISNNRALPYPELESAFIAPNMVDAAEWHEQLRYLSETVAIVDDFRNWGFTIYRTADGSLTDQRWQQLLEKNSN
jgi:hypothetical protein